MSFYGCSLLSTQKFSLEKVTQLFSLTKTIESALINNSLEFSAQWQELLQQKVAMLVFFEPSTRTSLSFQMACERIRLPYINFPAFEQSSLIKGESFEDTLFNVAAMKPDLIILRSSKGNEVTDFLEELKIPVVNAGSGVDGHPTQALLDAYTIQKKIGISGRTKSFNRWRCDS